MLKYLIINKGQKYYHSIGTYCESLSTAKKRYIEYQNRGLENIFILESKDPCECIYRLKKYINGNWLNSAWIDTTNDIYAEPLYHYAEQNIDDYYRYRKHEEENFNETPSFYEWVHRNDMSIRDFIYWLYDNGYVTI